tara:strand:- start:17560 stop:18210 length:651 start_codon:yes stop_codon:yes gene_type:complete
MSFTYAEIKQAIQDYTENYETTFVNNIPLFIRFAEDKILKQVQLDLFRKTQTTNFVSENPYLNVPSDFLAPFSLSWSNAGNEVFFVDFKDPSFLREYQGDTDTSSQPRYYAMFDNENFVLSPKPDLAYVAQLSYFYRPPSLTAGGDGDSTWLSINAETTLLYASLVEASIFMKSEPDVMQSYAARISEGIQQLKMLGEAKQSTDQYRTGMIVRGKQ